MKGKPTRGKAVNVEKTIKLYKQGLSMAEIGRISGHPHGVISYHLYKSNILIRKSYLRKPEYSTEYIKSLYDKGMSTVEIGEIIKMSPQAIYSRLLKAGIPLRSFSEAITLAAKRGRKKQQTGENNANWKGGRSIDKQGYIEIRVDGKQRREHRVVWENHNGEIPKGYIIHHMNGIRTDNRIENLAALPRKRHSPITIIKIYQERIRQLELKIKEIRGI